VYEYCNLFIDGLYHQDPIFVVSEVHVSRI
jgi:hypothetical protein